MARSASSVVSCALGMSLVLGIGGCGAGAKPPTAPTADDVKPFLAGELGGKLLLDLKMGTPPGVPPVPEPRALPGMANPGAFPPGAIPGGPGFIPGAPGFGPGGPGFGPGGPGFVPGGPGFAIVPAGAAGAPAGMPVILPPIPPPATLRAPGSSVAAQLADVTIKKVAEVKDQPGSWVVDIEGEQELSEDLYATIDVVRTMTALGWSDQPYRKGREEAMMCRDQAVRLKLMGQGLETERTRSWAMELKHAKGSKLPFSGNLTAKVNEAGGYTMMLITVMPREVLLKDHSLASSIPAGIVRFDRKNLGDAAKTWAKPFDDFLASVKTAKEAETEQDRTRTLEVIACAENFADILESIKDEASAKAAVEALDKLAPRMAAIRKQITDKPSQPSAFAHEFRDDLLLKTRTATERAERESKRIIADQALTLIAGPAIIRYGEVSEGRAPSTPVGSTASTPTRRPFGSREPAVENVPDPAQPQKTADILWDYPGLKLDRTFLGVNDLAMTRDGTKLVTVAWTHEGLEPAAYTLWDLATGAKLSAWQDRHRSRTSALSDDGSLLICSGHADRSARLPQIVIFKLPEGRLIRTIHLKPTDNVWTDTLAFDSTGRKAFWTSYGATEIDTESGETEVIVKESPIQQVAISPETGAIAVVSTSELKIWAQKKDYLAQKPPTIPWKRVGLSAVECQFTPDGKQAFALVQDTKDKDLDQLLGWEVRTKKQLLNVKVSTPETEDKKPLNGDGRFLVSPDGAYVIGWSQTHQWRCKVSDKSITKLHLPRSRLSFLRPLAITRTNIAVLETTIDGVKFMDLETGELIERPERK